MGRRRGYEAPGDSGGYRYTGDGKPHKMIRLYLSDDVTDQTVISVYDASGHMIARGHWYEDHILDLDGLYGVATGDRAYLDFHLTEGGGPVGVE